MTRRVESFCKPVIAAVNGLAYGGGCELVGSAHLALAADTAFFASRRSIRDHPDLRRHPAASRNVGRKAAIELILTGRSFGAAQAARLGLINRVVTGADLIRTAIDLAKELAAKPPLAVAAALSAIHRGMDAAIDDGLSIEGAAFARSAPTRDASEGVAAFLEKRAPSYLGR
jgi:enoyl-CoA hydratase/carnithine racemase